MCLGRRAILAQKSISYFVFDEGLKLVVRETFQKKPAIRMNLSSFFKANLLPVVETTSLQLFGNM